MIPAVILRNEKLRNEKLRNEKDLSCQTGLFSIGGGHGTRTHGALPPYLISNQAP